MNRFVALILITVTLSGCGTDPEEMHDILKGAYESLHDCSVSLKSIAVSMDSIDQKMGEPE